MKVQLLSDLHLEFANFDYISTDADIVVLAGDIHTKGRGLPWAIENIKEKPVLYVLGNHEFYKKTYPKLIHSLKNESAGSNVHILEENIFTLEGINFIGCTLWTDFNLFGNPRTAGYTCQIKMNDYKQIKRLPGYSKVRSVDIALINKKSQNWLWQTLAEKEGQKNVVVSHHGPSLKSVPAHYHSDIVTSGYVSDFEDNIKELRPDFWLHGHMHNSSDYRIGDCRVLCNPRGYPDGPNPEFYPTFCFEV